MYSIIILILFLFISIVFSSYTGEYIIVTENKNWNDANNYCISQYNTELATFKNDDDITKIFEIISTSCKVL